MKKDLQNIKKRALPVLRKAGVRRSAIFGSYARGENKKNSDIDFLVELPRGTTLFDLVELQTNLEKVLRKKADVITYRSLHPLLKDRILSEQIRIL